MATERQIAANRLNSQKSSGPKSPDGKAPSSRNHLSHGFTSNTAKLIGGEDPEKFKALLADLMGEYQPATPTEQILVEKMVQNQWLSGRAFRLESDVLTMRIHSMITIPHDLGLFIRYQRAADSAFHKAHTELVKAQEKRKKSEREASEIGFFRKYRATPVREGWQVTSNLGLICVHLCSSLRPSAFLFYVRTTRASCVRPQFSFPGVTVLWRSRLSIRKMPPGPLTSLPVHHAPNPQLRRNRLP